MQVYFAIQQQTTNRLIHKFKSWACEGSQLNRLCSFNKVSFGNTEGSYVSFDHHTEQNGVNYFRMDCVGECGDQWTCDFGIHEDGNVEVTAISVNKSADIMDDIQHLTDRFGPSNVGIRLLSAS